VVVNIFVLSVLSVGYFGFHEVMDLSELASEGLCLALSRVVYLKVGFKLEFGIHAIVREEGQKSSSLGNVVVGGELGEG
jgi:hypothetical protein